MGEKAVWLPRSLAPCGDEGMAGGQDGRPALHGSRRGERGRLGERKWTDGRSYTFMILLRMSLACYMHCMMGREYVRTLFSHH